MFHFFVRVLVEKTLFGDFKFIPLLAFLNPFLDFFFSNRFVFFNSLRQNFLKLYSIAVMNKHHLYENCFFWTYFCTKIFSKIRKNFFNVYYFAVIKKHHFYENCLFWQCFKTKIF